MTTVKRAVDSITPAIRVFGNREKGLTNWTVAREDDLRDLLYAMLRASISDLKTEEAIPKHGGTSKYVDIYSELAGLFIEVKWINKKGQWKNIQKQINDDIQSYIVHPHCRNLMFIIVDAARDFPDPRLFENELSGKQKIKGKEVQVLIFIREP